MIRVDRSESLRVTPSRSESLRVIPSRPSSLFPSLIPSLNPSLNPRAACAPLHGATQPPPPNPTTLGAGREPARASERATGIEPFKFYQIFHLSTVLFVSRERARPRRDGADIRVSAPRIAIRAQTRKPGPLFGMLRTLQGQGTGLNLWAPSNRKHRPGPRLGSRGVPRSPQPAPPHTRARART